MLPPDVLNEVRSIAAGNRALEVDFVEKGGHAGFVSGSIPWQPYYYAEHRVGEFFARYFS
jgi:predicted alpha/beta-fold hydrolase